MSTYTEIHTTLKLEQEKNLELQAQIRRRTEKMLSEFWKLMPTLKSVDNVELTAESMSAWVKRRRAGHA